MPAPRRLPTAACRLRLPKRLPQEFSSDRVIISFKPDIVRAMAAEEEGLRFQKPAGLQGAVVYTITDGSSVASKIEQLQSHPGACRAGAGAGM
jgi:hypothetical protein